MITSLSTYVLNIPISDILERYMNHPERIALSDMTYMTSIADLVTIGVKTLRIDNGCLLEKEFTELIRMHP